MPATNRPWLPTTPGQSAVVYTLTLLFMLNTTVLLLLVSGELSPANANASRAFADAMPVNAAASVQPIQRDTTKTEPAVVVVEEIKEPVKAVTPTPTRVSPPPVIEVVNEPVVTEQPVFVESPLPEPQQPEPKQPEPKQPPVEFFGVPIE